MTQIRTTDRDGIVGILAAGRPAGFWMAQIQDNPKAWTGAHANGKKTVIKCGTFAEVLEWLQRRADIRQDRSRDRVIRDASDNFCGLRVTSAGQVRIPEERMKRAANYSGFGIRTQKQKTGLKTPGHDALRHGNTGLRKETDEKSRKMDEEILGLSRNGLLQKEIAERLGVREKCVQNRVIRMRERGIAVPCVYAERKAAERMEKLAEVRRLWIDEGLGYTEIARRMGITKSAVGRWVQELRDADGGNK